MTKVDAVRGLLPTLMCAAAFAIVPPLPALAATVTGMDDYDVTDGSVDAFIVEGDPGEAVFFNVLMNDARATGRLIASHLAYTVSDEGSDVVSLTGLSLPASTTYAVDVYGDRSEGEDDLLYQGVLSPVYAKIEDAGTKLIAARTMSPDGSEDDRSFSAPGTIEKDGVTFELVSDGLDEDGMYAYAASHAAESAQVVINYVDDEGDSFVDPTATLPTLAWGDSATVSIPRVVQDDSGLYYRTLALNPSVKASYPGTTEFTVRVSSLTGGYAPAADKHFYYLATIKMVDENGDMLATDQVNVTGKYYYTAPSTLYKTDANNMVRTFSLVGSYNDNINEDLTYDLANGAAIVLDPAEDGIETGAERVITLPYTTSPSTAAATFEIVPVIAADSSAGTPARNLDALTARYTVKPGERVEHRVDQALEVDGAVYVPVAGTAQTLTFEYGLGDDPIQYVYYVPKDYQAEKAYTVTVNYVDIVTRSIVKTAEYTMQPTMREDAVLEAEETFTEGGATYVRLDGQESGIRHGYYSTPRVYTVYYRNESDDLNSDTVISRIRVQYQPTMPTQPTGGESTTGSGAAAPTGPNGETGANGGTGTGGETGSGGESPAVSSENAGQATAGGQASPTSPTVPASTTGPGAQAPSGTGVTQPNNEETSGDEAASAVNSAGPSSTGGSGSSNSGTILDGGETAPAGAADDGRTIGGSATPATPTGPGNEAADEQGAPGRTSASGTAIGGAADGAGEGTGGEQGGYTIGGSATGGSADQGEPGEDAGLGTEQPGRTSASGTAVGGPGDTDTPGEGSESRTIGGRATEIPSGNDLNEAGNATAPDGTATVGLPSGTDLTTIDGDGSSTVVNTEGTDINTVRIEDDDTPLAQIGQPGGTATEGRDDSEKPTTSARKGVPIIAGIVEAAVIAFVGGIVALLGRRRNQRAEKK